MNLANEEMPVRMPGKVLWIILETFAKDLNSKKKRGPGRIFLPRFAKDSPS